MNRICVALSALLLTTAAYAAPVVDANQLKAWIDANDFEAVPPVIPPIEPPTGDVQLPPQASGYKLTFNDEFSVYPSISHLITMTALSGIPRPNLAACHPARPAIVSTRTSSPRPPSSRPIHSPSPISDGGKALLCD